MPQLDTNYESDRGIDAVLFSQLMNRLCKTYPNRLIGDGANAVRSHLAEAAAIVESWPVKPGKEETDAT